MTLKNTTVPLVAVVVSQTMFPAGIVALLNDVVDSPPLVFVQVVPPVTTSVPAAVKSVPYLMEKVTLGVVPDTNDTILVIVPPLLQLKIGIFSEAFGLDTVMDLSKPKSVLNVASVLTSGTPVPAVLR